MLRLVLIVLAVCLAGFFLLPTNTFWIIMTCLAELTSAITVCALLFFVWLLAPWKILKKPVHVKQAEPQTFIPKEN